MAKLITYPIIISLLMLLSACGSNGQTKVVNTNVDRTEASAETVQLKVYAAASLSEALKEVQELFESEHEDIVLTFNFATTPLLQKNIEQGDDADLFIGETSGSMKSLLYNDLIDPDNNVTLLRDELVVIGLSKRKEAIGALENLADAGVNRIGIGEPDSVSAGKYAKEALTNVSLWDTLSVKMVQAKDYKQVLQYVETGNVDAGFVYKSTAASSNKVVTLFAVDPAIYPAIEFPAGIIKATKHREQSELLYSFLQSEAAMSVFKKHGFAV